MAREIEDQNATLTANIIVQTAMQQALGKLSENQTNHGVAIER